MPSPRHWGLPKYIQTPRVSAMLEGCRDIVVFYDIKPVRHTMLFHEDDEKAIFRNGKNAVVIMKGKIEYVFPYYHSDWYKMERQMVTRDHLNDPVEIIISQRLEEVFPWCVGKVIEVDDATVCTVFVEYEQAAMLILNDVAAPAPA